MDSVFSETNAGIRLSSSVHETSLVQEEGESEDTNINEVGSREKMQFRLTNRFRQLAMKMWIAQMTNTKALLKGLKMNLTWTQLTGKLPRKKMWSLSLLTKNQSKSDQKNRLQVKLPVN